MLLRRLCVGFEQTGRDKFVVVVLAEQLAKRVGKLLRNGGGEFGEDALDGIAGELADDLLRHGRDGTVDAEIEETADGQTASLVSWF